MSSIRSLALLGAGDSRLRRLRLSRAGVREILLLWFQRHLAESPRLTLLTPGRDGVESVAIDLILNSPLLAPPAVTILPYYRIGEPKTRSHRKFDRVLVIPPHLPWETAFNMQADVLGICGLTSCVLPVSFRRIPYEILLCQSHSTLLSETSRKSSLVNDS